MPIYEYRCRKCNSVNEVLVKNPSDEPKSCQKCGASEVERLMSVPAPCQRKSGGSPDLCKGDFEACGKDAPCHSCPSFDE